LCNSGITWIFLSLYSPTVFLYLVRSIESNSRSPSLASEKSRIE
jgi:hypothetical protein